MQVIRWKEDWCQVQSLTHLQSCLPVTSKGLKYAWKYKTSTHTIIVPNKNTKQNKGIKKNRNTKTCRKTNWRNTNNESLSSTCIGRILIWRVANLVKCWNPHNGAIQRSSFDTNTIKQQHVNCPHNKTLLEWGVCGWHVLSYSTRSCWKESWYNLQHLLNLIFSSTEKWSEIEQEKHGDNPSIFFF